MSQKSTKCKIMSLPKDANTAQETLVDFFTKYLDWQMRKIHTHTSLAEGHCGNLKR